MLKSIGFVVVSLFVAGIALAADESDPFQWLEEVHGEKAMAWVKAQNQQTAKVLEAIPEFKPIAARTLEILDSKEKIPFPETLGAAVYNFWRDEKKDPVQLKEPGDEPRMTEDSMAAFCKSMRTGTPPVSGVVNGRMASWGRWGSPRSRPSAARRCWRFRVRGWQSSSRAVS